MQPPQNDGHFVRMLQRVPERLSPLYAFAYDGRLWLVCLSENLPRTICEVDADKETVTRSWKVYDYTYPQAAIVLRQQGYEARLAHSGYQKWEVDKKRELAYALRFDKPARSPLAYAHGFQQIDVVRLHTQQIQQSIPCSGVTDVALSPDGRWLYAVRGGYTDEALRVREGEYKVMVQVWDTVRSVWSTQFAWGPCAVVFLKGFVLNGCYVVLAQAAPWRGVIFIDTRTHAEPSWSTRIQHTLRNRYGAAAKVYDGIAVSGHELYTPVAFWDDKNEIVPLYNRPQRRADSGVAVIDLLGRQVRRVLGLSEADECLSAAVCRNKLFVTSRDGEVFVIDIDAWRKNPK